MPQMYSRQEPEKEMRNTILISLLLMLLPVSVSAQFYTITRDSALLPTERQKESYNRAGKDVTEGKKNKMMVKDTLETGWFRSSVCRNKHNLFGLTNPRTGKYYEFNHWTESVQAYYTKVQYKYNGGNYLLWLEDIGYAEDSRYIICLCNVLKYL